MAEFRQITVPEFRDNVQVGSELRWESGNDEFGVIARILVVTKGRTYVQADILEIIKQGESTSYKVGDRVDAFRNQIYVEVKDESNKN